MKIKQSIQLLGAKLRAHAIAKLYDKRHAAAQRTQGVPALQAISSKASSSENLAKKPLNVLMIVADQLRHWEDLPQNVPLPAHEWLKSRGVAMSNFHVNTTPCSPSRSNIYFGQHTTHTKMVANYGAPPFPEIPKDMPSLGDYFRAQGYYTAYKGKWHLSDLDARYDLTYGKYPNSIDALEHFGFSEYNFDGDPHGSTWTGYKFDQQIASEAIHWLNHKPAKLEGKPWLMAVNFVNPHDIMYFAASEAQVASKRGRDFLAPSAPEPADELYQAQWNTPLPDTFKTEDLSKKPWAHGAYRDFCTMAFGAMPYSDEAAWQRYINYYLNCIRDVDRQMLAVLETLERTGQLDNTMIVFTADHGEMAGAHGLRQKGPFIYRENTRVPMVVVHPDLKAHAGTSVTGLGAAVDLIPTLLSMAISHVQGSDVQAAYPALKGENLLPALRGEATKRDERGILFNYNVRHYTDPSYVAALIDSGSSAGARMVLEVGQRTGRWVPDVRKPGFFHGIHAGRYKFARYFSPMVTERPASWEALTDGRFELELYDLQLDPNELRNLAHPDTRDFHRATIENLNEKLNELIAVETLSA